MICNEWKKVKLKDITIDGKGYYGIGASAVEYNEALLTYLRITDITDDGRIIKEGLKSVNDKDAKDYILKENDIVFARTGNSTGRSYFYEKKDGILVYAGFLIKFTLDKNKVNPKFIRYYTLTEDYKNWIESFSTGSTRKNINAKMYADMEIKLPPRNIQDKIVNLMDSLDNKIELNNEMNKTLEEIAQSIFKRWFVDFEFPNEDDEPYKSSGGDMVGSEKGIIPKGWEVNKISNISNVTMGVSPNSKTYNEDKIGLPLLNGASDFQGKLINPSKFTSEPKKICQKGDMVFGVRATIGNIVFADKEYALGRGVASVKPNDTIFREFIYYSLDNSMENLINNASGSVFLNLKKADITDLKVCYSKEIVNKFNSIAKLLINKIIENDIESEYLKQQRDTLLPKLMNCEVKLM